MRNILKERIMSVVNLKRAKVGENFRLGGDLLVFGKHSSEHYNRIVEWLESGDPDLTLTELGPEEISIFDTRQSQHFVPWILILRIFAPSDVNKFDATEMQSVLHSID